MPLLNTAGAVYLGAQAVDRVYLGADRVWPSGFIPADLTGLLFWLDAARITGTADGAPLLAWADASGNGLDAVTAVYPATYRSDGINGHPAVGFGEAGMSEFQIAPGRAVGSRTVFQVVQISEAPYGTYHTTQFQNGVPYLQTYSTGGVIHTYANPGVLSSGVVWSGACQFISLWCADDGTHGLRVDDTEVAGVWMPAATSAPFHIGANAAAAYGMRGRIGELVVYDRCLTGPERQAVLDYLDEKWGLA